MKLNGLTRAMGRHNLKLQKNSPALLFGAGLIGVIGSTVLACRATLKLQDTLEGAQERLEVLGDGTGQNDTLILDEPTRKREITKVYVETTWQITKLYGPSVLLGAAAVGCLTKSHNILNQRNLALTAAYAAVERAFEEYRGRVIDKYGPEQDQEFRYETEQVQLLDERGKMTTVTRAAKSDEPSMYARFYDPVNSSQWDVNPEYNLVFLKCQQEWANQMLKARGHVFLNEVYDALGLDRTKAGSVVGWVVSDDGDNYIDFGIYNDRNNERVRDFVNGHEGAILLDFNVDGIIYDRIAPEDRRQIGWQK